MLPKVIFRQSALYDRALKRDPDFKIPEHSIFQKHLRKLQREWKKNGIRVLKEIALTTKLKWHEKEIVCYLTAGVMPYSDPLTLNLRSNFDTLTHELIHRILSEPQNWNAFKKNWKRLMKKYKKEPEITKIHVVIHAIHADIFKKLFSKERLEKERNAIKNKMYIRAWEIVNRDGYKNILKELTV